MLELFSLIIVLLLVAIVYLAWRYSKLLGNIETRARELFEKWKVAELETRANEQAKIMFEKWKQEEEKKIREDAVKRSEAVIKGKVTEHLTPFLPDFRYNPKDARFIGSPVDFVVFDGLSEGQLKKIVFVEVKTGKTATLSDRERTVRDCIENRNVAFEIIHLK